MGETKKVKEPGIEDENIYWTMFRIFGVLQKDQARAAVEAAFYVTYIKLSPAKMEDIIKYARKLTNQGKSYTFFRKAIGYLLEDGLIAQIVTTADFRHTDEFGRAAFLPINPKILFELNECKLIDHLQGELEITKKRIDNLSQDFYKKFSIEALKERCTRGIAEEEISNITLYYSGMWVTYTLADNIQKNSIVSMMLNGARVCDNPQIAYYKKILEKDIKIRTILTTTEDITQIESRIQSIQSPINPNIIIKHAPKESYKTCRMTIVDNVFALDGRKLIHLGSKEPSYTGTLYLDDKYMNSIKDIFETVWNRLG